MPQDNLSAEDIEAQILADQGQLENADGDPVLDEPQSPEYDEPEISEDDLNRAAVLEASRKGWQPKSKFKGPADKWVDAATFLERGEKFNKNLQEKVAQLESKLAQFQGNAAQFAKFHEETIAKKQSELDEAIRQLRVQRSQATREGEDEVAVALEDRIEELKAEKQAVGKIEKPEEQEQRPAGPNPNDLVLQEWAEDGNQWWNEEPRMQAYAVSLGESLIKSGETARGRPFLDKVAEQMRIQFPRYFRLKEGNANSRKPQGAEGTGSRSSVGKPVRGKTEADLPEVDRKLMEQFVSEGWTTREKFLDSYFSR